MTMQTLQHHIGIQPFSTNIFTYCHLHYSVMAASLHVLCGQVMLGCHHLGSADGGGGLQVTYSIHTVRVELYESAGDYVRLVLEILLTIWVTIHLLTEFWAIIQARRRQVC